MLRPVQATDVAVFFEQQSDPDAAHMAAFTVNDPGDPDLFAQQWRTIFENDAITSFTVQHQGAVADMYWHTRGPGRWRSATGWVAASGVRELPRRRCCNCSLWSSHDPSPRMSRTTMWGRCEFWRSAALR